MTIKRGPPEDRKGRPGMERKTWVHPGPSPRKQGDTGWDPSARAGSVAKASRNGKESPWAARVCRRRRKGQRRAATIERGPILRVIEVFSNFSFAF